MSSRRLQVTFGPGSRGDYEFTRRTRPGATPSRAPNAPPAEAPARRPRAAEPWIGAGIMRSVLLALIVVGGVAAVVWIRDLATAVGVHWVNGG